MVPVPGSARTDEDRGLSGEGGGRREEESGRREEGRVRNRMSSGGAARYCAIAASKGAVGGEKRGGNGVEPEQRGAPADNRSVREVRIPCVRAKRIDA